MEKFLIVVAVLLPATPFRIGSSFVRATERIAGRILVRNTIGRYILPFSSFP